MEQTVSMNLAGLVFHIEKPAYEDLRQYLRAIRSYVEKGYNPEDTMQDIESRIAELFEQQLGSRKEVITQKDVARIKQEMGNPSTFSDQEEQPSTNDKQQEETGKGFPIARDPENGVLGGVCAGIGTCYQFNPVWLRLAFIAALLFFGTGILAYLALWIVLPAKKKSGDTAQPGWSFDRETNRTDFWTGMKSRLRTLTHALEVAITELVKACRRAIFRVQHHS